MPEKTISMNMIKLCGMNERKEIIAGTNAFINYIKCSTEVSDYSLCGRMHSRKPTL